MKYIIACDTKYVLFVYIFYSDRSKNKMKQLVAMENDWESFDKHHQCVQWLIDWYTPTGDDFCFRFHNFQSAETILKNADNYEKSVLVLLWRD